MKVILRQCFHDASSTASDQLMQHSFSTTHDRNYCTRESCEISRESLQPRPRDGCLSYACTGWQCNKTPRTHKVSYWSLHALYLSLQRMFSLLQIFLTLTVWSHSTHAIILTTYWHYVSQGGVVGIATDYRLDDRGFGVRVPAVPRIFSPLRLPNWLWVPHSLLSNGYRGPFPRGKAVGAEAHYSPPTSAGRENVDL